MNKKYKKFALKTLLLMLIFPLIFMVIELYIGEKIIGKKIIKFGESQMIDYWITTKRNYALESDKKSTSKIVILSGSNSLYGVNASDMEKVFKKPTVNYGTHKGLLNYIFFDAKRILNKGDIVILPLEYDYYIAPNSTENLSTTAIEYILGYDYEYYKQLSLKDKYKVLNYMLKLKSLLSIGKNRDLPNDLNKNGDITTENIKNNYLEEHPEGRVFEEQVSLDIIKEMPLYSFLKWCKDNDITVYTTYPNVQHKKETTKKEEEFFNQIKHFYELANVKFVGDLKNSFFENKYIYNTEYHLNLLGKKKRTEYLIDLFKDMVK